MDEDTVLLEFKAGKMALVGTRLQSDTRKGMVRLVRASDMMLHLQWCLRTDNTTESEPEDDVIIFPDEAKFERIPQPNARVYILKFPQESDRNVFFWLQDPDVQQDAELAAAVNQIINTPAGMDEDSEDGEGEGEEMVVGAPAAAAASGSSAPSTSGLANDPRALAQLLSLGLQSAMNPGGDLATMLRNAQAAQEQYQAPQGPSLAEVLKPETLAPLFADPDLLPRCFEAGLLLQELVIALVRGLGEELPPDRINWSDWNVCYLLALLWVQAADSSLAEHLPDGQQDADSLVKLARSSQFHQQLRAFSSALQTGQLDLMQFGLKAKGFSTADFLEAVQDMVDGEAAGKGPQGGQA